jgi:hypothetical protein
MANFFKKNKIIISGILLVLFFGIFYFDKELLTGLSVLAFLSAITVFVLDKLRIKDKKIYWLFLIALVVHLISSLFMHYANFQPFSGGQGDYLTYQKSAVELSQSFRQGDFSIKSIALKHPDLYVLHYYPIIIGVLYALTLPAEIIGLMLNVWLAAVTIVFVYLVILELGAMSKNAFIMGLAAIVYPSYIFNSGLLLKDTLEIFFVFLGMLFLIKTIKRFTWYSFALFYIATLCATHFRFYIGYALILTFVVSWFFLSKMDIKKRAIYGAIFIILLGFIPQLAYNQGYYGINSLKSYLNYKMVAFYRESAYDATYLNSAYSDGAPSNKPTSNQIPVSETPLPVSSSRVGFDSSFSAQTTPLGYLKSFIYVLLGPLPWQLNSTRQLLALFETLPWYLMLFFVIDGIIIGFKNRIREAAPLLIFSVVTMVLMAIFYNNFGIIVRIRIPAFISLLCIASLGLNKNNIIYSFLYNYYKRLTNQLFIKKLRIWQNI